MIDHPAVAFLALGFSGRDTYHLVCGGNKYVSYFNTSYSI